MRTLFRASSRLLGTMLMIGLAFSCNGPTDDQGDGGMPSSPHPVALLVLDGLRADSVDGMPFLASFAKESIRFDWAFAQAPDAAASLASTLTGLYPTTHGLVEAGEQLTGDALTLAELLGEARFKTAAFIDSDQAMDDLGLQQGFDTFETGDGALDSAMAWVAGKAGKNFFVLAATNAVSVAATQGDEAGARARYDAALGTLDGQLRTLVEQLDPSVTVVVLATHGSELGDRSIEDGPTLHISRSRVPLMIRLPGGSAARSVDKVVELVDLLPTLLELTGTSVPLELQGASLIPVIEGQGTPPYIAFGESPHRKGQQFAVMAGYRLILSKGDDTVELYELASDPLETNALPHADSTQAQVLRDRLADWEKFIAATSLDSDRRIELTDDATIKRLRQIGYLQ